MRKFILFLFFINYIFTLNLSSVENLKLHVENKDKINSVTNPENNSKNLIEKRMSEIQEYEEDKKKKKKENVSERILKDKRKIHHKEEKIKKTENKPVEKAFKKTTNQPEKYAIKATEDESERNFFKKNEKENEKVQMRKPEKVSDTIKKVENIPEVYKMKERKTDSNIVTTEKIENNPEVDTFKEVEEELEEDPIKNTKNMNKVKIIETENDSEKDLITKSENEPLENKDKKTENKPEIQIKSTLDNLRDPIDQINKNEHHENLYFDLSKIKSKIEIYIAIIMGYLENSNGNDYIWKNSSNAQHNYFFSILKLTALILVLIAIFLVIKKYFMHFLFTKELIELNNKNSNREMKANSSISKRNSNETINFEESIKLKGRIKRVPKPINYTELFCNNDIYGTNEKVNETTNVHHNDNICTIEEFFNQVNQNQKIKEFLDETNYKKNENLTCINTKSTIHYNSNIILESQFINEFDEKIKNKSEIKNFWAEKNNLEEIKEQYENENEVDEHTLIFNRLASNNFIQKTAISNFITKKPSL